MRVIFFLFILLASEVRAQFTIESFTAVQSIRNRVLLNWVVSPGNTCADLVLQMSVDSVNFTTIYEYPGICGNTTFSQSYQYEHSSEQCNELRYYRLASVSGSTFANTVAHLLCYNENGIAVKFDTQNSELIADADIPSGEQWILQLYSPNGSLALSQELTKGRNVAVWNPAIAGIYIYTIMSADRKVFSDRLLIVR